MAREGNVFTFKEGSLLIRTGQPRIDVSSPQKKPGHSNYPRYFYYIYSVQKFNTFKDFPFARVMVSSKMTLCLKLARKYFTTLKYLYGILETCCHGNVTGEHAHEQANDGGHRN